ncbi:MAG TPA: hypothetical protein VLA66_13570 [Thermoanaerobaculia bacterium]|nr:hypothetical protein [Thermoanaerobaculia bacterium]
MASIRPFLLLVAAATLGCGAEPQIQVETAPAGEPAAQTAPGAPEVQAAHEPVAAPAGEQLPEGHPPLDAMQAGGFELAPVDPSAGRGESGLSWQAPASWVAEPPANSMRRAQYKVPGPGGEGECVVFYFGPGQGGSPQANAERWAAQFEQPDGRSPLDAMTTRELEGAASKSLIVEVAGTYQSGSMMGGPATESKPGWALLGAVVEGADANWFFKFTGPEATVAANREGFEEMIRSVNPGG